MRHWGRCGHRIPIFAGMLIDEAVDIDDDDKEENMMDSSSILVPPSVVVVGDVGERAIEALERSGLSVRVAERSADAFSAFGPAPGPGMILLDMRIPEQMLDMRAPEQMEQLLLAANRAREFADVVVVVLSEFEEVREDRASGLFVMRSFDAATLRRISQISLPEQEPVSYHAPEGEPARIMVVEDDSDLREALAALLDDAGYDVATAAHGREALGELSSLRRPSLVLLDMMMPVLDGWGFMAACKRDPALSSIPVVVVSAGSSALFDSAPGACAYLSKPLDRTKLLQTIRSCLRENASIMAT